MDPLTPVVTRWTPGVSLSCNEADWTNRTSEGERGLYDRL